MSSTLIAALGGMRSFHQWFVWRLTWDAAEQKYKKHPARPDCMPYPMDARVPQNWQSYEGAIGTLNLLRSLQDGHAYTLGFALTEECGYWFLDIDKCVTATDPSTGAKVITELAQQLLNYFPGAAVEWSSSGNGLHIFGRGTVPENFRAKNEHLGIEFYTSKRGIAFGLDDVASGSADIDWSATIYPVVSHYFPPREVLEGEVLPATGPRADWHGPQDDDVLLAKAMASKSAGAMFGVKASFADLFTGNMENLQRVYGPEADSEWDMALAQHLCYWTGCDVQRIETIMRRSRLVRDKWDEKRPRPDGMGDTTWLGMTILNSAAKQRDVYQERERVVPTDMYQSAQPQQQLALGMQMVGVGDYDEGGDAAPIIVSASLITPEQTEACERLLNMVADSADVADIHNRVIPAIRASCLVPALLPRLESAVNTRLALWGAKLQVAKLRALLNPPLEARAAGNAPEFAKSHVYITSDDSFFDLNTATLLTKTGFNANYNRLMPKRENGQSEDAAQWCLERWDMPTVHFTMYRPGHPDIFSYSGLTYANLYNERGLPECPAHYTDVGIAGIEAFRKHLWALMGGREWLYMHVLHFLAHNVQYPGVKIRHAPLIKGVQGDGKSLLLEVLREAMGHRNVTTIGPNDVANQGGFTGWAHGSALCCINEIMLVGKDRYKVSNLVKPFITDNTCSVTGKGENPKTVVNTQNQMALTNYIDAVPLDDDDRRWLIIFSPYASKHDMLRALGLNTADDLTHHFNIIFHSIQQCPGEWRKWLLSIEIPTTFDPNGPAPDTPEKERMRVSGRDDAELMARHVVEEGAYGIGHVVLSSNCLTAQLKSKSITDNFDLPKTTTISHMLTRMGFSQKEKPIKWDGKTHRVWGRNGSPDDNDAIRALLDSTKR